VANVTFNPLDSGQQYGVSAVPNCGPNANLSSEFQPVLFWFYRTTGDSFSQGRPQAAGVFCAPTLEVFHIIGNASLNSGELLGVTRLDPVSSENNVTGAPLNGVPYNACVILLHQVICTNGQV